jgi:hypothetical protein
MYRLRSDSRAAMNPSSFPHGLPSGSANIIPAKRSGALYRPESKDATAYGDFVDEHNKRRRYQGPSVRASAWQQQYLHPVHLRMHHPQVDTATTPGDGLALRPTTIPRAGPASFQSRWPSLDPPSPTPQFNVRIVCLSSLSSSLLLCPRGCRGSV